LVIIDGHNLLFKRCDTFNPSIEAEIEKQTNKLLSILKDKKSIIVYDGSGGLNEYGYKKIIQNNITLVYSGSFQKADDWIVDWIKNNSGESVILISDDLKLRKRINVKRVKFEDCIKWFRRNSKSSQILRSTKNEFGSTEYWNDYFDE
jgi:hypothetical protein